MLEKAGLLETEEKPLISFKKFQKIERFKVELLSHKMLIIEQRDSVYLVQKFASKPHRLCSQISREPRFYFKLARFLVSTILANNFYGQFKLF